MSLRLTILGSGSAGNCALIETSEETLLVDAGFSGLQIKRRMESVGASPERIDAILVTHEHKDHIQGIKPITRKHNTPVYCNRLTKEAIERSLSMELRAQIFETGHRFPIGGLEVESFPISHDAYDPVGYIVQASGVSVGFLTDLGHVTKATLDRLRLVDALILETNYDPDLLESDLRRPWSAKQRTASRHGHLSNAAAGDVLRELVSPRLRHVFLAHLSRDCNREELALDALRTVLTDAPSPAPKLHLTYQEKPTTPIVIETSEGG